MDINSSDYLQRKKEFKLAMLFPYAPAYRGPIYELMDRELSVDWFFCGDAERPMKLYDYSRLKNCNLSMKEKQLIGPFVRFDGIKQLPLDQYDAIIVPTIIRNTSMWWLLKKYSNGKRGPKLFYWTHGWYGREKGLSKIIKKRFYSGADGFFLYNNRAKQLMLSMGYPEEKLHIIYNSLDYETQLKLRQTLSPTPLYQEHFGNDNKNIVFIGRLTTEKRFDLLLEAVSQLKQKGVLLNVTFIGDGVERQNMESFVAEKGIADQVWFYGACYDERRNAELIFNADLCVSPGNIGLTAIHVLMFGCPTITCDDLLHQGPEFEAIVENKTGAFFTAGNSESLANKINEWFTNHREDREVVRQNCYLEIDSHWNPEYQLKILKDVLCV